MGAGTPVSQGSGLLPAYLADLLREVVHLVLPQLPLLRELLLQSPQALVGLRQHQLQLLHLQRPGEGMGTTGCAWPRLPASLPDGALRLPLSPAPRRDNPIPTAPSPTPGGHGSLPVSYLGGVGVVVLRPAGFVAPGMRGVHVLGVGDAVRVGVPKIRLLHAWAS